jgi:septum formation inhibitor MinC
LPKKLR